MEKNAYIAESPCCILETNNIVNQLDFKTNNLVRMNFCR